MSKPHYLQLELSELFKTNEAIFRFLQESSLDGMWYWDLLHPEEEWMNEKFWTVLGYSPEEMPHKSYAWKNIIHPHDAELALEKFKEHCQDPTIPYDQTLRYTHKNGSTVWIRCRGIVIRDSQGTPIRMLGTHQNVTRFKEVELQLTVNATLLYNTQKIARIGSWELDLKTNEVTWTKELYDMYGFDPNLPPPPYTEHMKLFTPTSWDILNKSLTITSSQGIPYELELTTVQKNGENGYMWVRGEAVFDEQKNIIGLRGVAQDITEKKSIELEKEKITKHLNYALDASGDGIWDWTPANGVTVYSKAWIEMLGYQVHEIQSLASEWSNRLHPEDAPWVFAEITKCTESPNQGDNFVQEYRFLNKEGKYLWILNKGKVVERNEKGEATRVVGTHTNITERKKSEDEIKRINMLLNDAQKMANMGAWDLDLATGNTFWTNEVYSIHEVNLDFEHNKVNGIDFYHPDDRPVITKAIEEAITQHIPFDVKCKLITAKNNLRIVRSTGYPIFQNGKVSHLVGMIKDITQDEADKQAVIREQMFSKQLIENLPDGFSVVNLQGIQIVVNKAFCEMTGFTEDELVGKRIPFPYWPEEDISAIQEAFQKGLFGAHENFEMFFKKKNGQRFPVLLSTSVLKDSQGEILNYFATIKDISEQKKREKELSDISREIQDITNAVNENSLVSITDKHGIIIKANQRFCELSGYTESELIGNTHQMINSGYHDRDFWNDLWKTILEGKTWKGEIKNKSKNGSIYWVSSVIKPIFDEFGKIVRFLSIRQDITERKLVEQAQRESELRLSLATQAGGVGIWDWDIKANCLSWDAQMFELYGLFPQSFLNAFDAWANGVYIDDRERAQQEIEMAVRGEKEFNTEFRIQEPSGRIRSIRALAKVLRDEKGNAIRMIGTNWDLTQEKEVLQQIEVAKELAEKASKAKSEFLANMSHEIRTPLNGVIGFTELLKSTSLTSVQQQYVNSANVAGHTLLAIINDILDFSKIEAGMLELDIVKTDLVMLFEDCIDIVKFSAEKKGLELLLNIDASLPRFAYIDPTRLKQIIANLLANAVKFTPKGEVELKIKFDAIQPHQGNITISVRDTGIGISEEQKSKLFKAFSQADSSTTRKFGGTGLGLAISGMIAEKMGSQIKLHSQIGQGTEFTLALSIQVEEETSRALQLPQDIHRCLVIDDNLTNQNILKSMLNKWSIEAVCCTNGLEAIKELEGPHQYDVILCDYTLPHIDGLETTRIIREKLKLTTHPIVMMHPATVEGELYDKCQEIGVSLILNKPLKRNELLDFLCTIHQDEIQKLDQTELKQLHENSPSLVTGTKTKILVAEDVPMNMMLIKIIISKLIDGAEIYEAENGKIALEQYKEILPDIILMDVHMPELDGIETTKQIREIETKTGRHTPILALTAGAFREEKEKCFLAGMDDFLTKPFEPEKAKEIFKKYIKLKSPIHSRKSPKMVNLEEHFGYTALTHQLDHDLEGIQQLISLTLEEMPVRLSQLEKACIDIDFKKMSEIAHSMKGACLSMQCSILAELAKKIELAGKSKQPVGIQVSLAGMKAEWEIVKGILSEKLKVSISN